MIVEAFYLYLVLIPGFTFFILAWHECFHVYGRIMFLFLSSVCLQTSSRLMLNFRVAGPGDVAMVFQNIMASNVEVTIASAVGYFSIVVFFLGVFFSIVEVVGYLDDKEENEGSRRSMKKGNVMEMSDRRGGL